MAKDEPTLLTMLLFLEGNFDIARGKRKKFYLGAQ